ncbi:MAG: DNA-deoxyinosine glycosylase [Ruminococcaceae bacterium]|nr:DNA-deoxyinosine glycosylase [Oscillospiraceae bacterium]
MIHPIPPLFDHRSRILILGSFPSVRSREVAFYYGHPQNRFWRVIAALRSEPLPTSVEEKKALLLAHGIALWDVIASCEISGSSDSSIRHVKPNDLARIFSAAKIQAVFLNGKTAFKIYEAHRKTFGYPPGTVLPSTSPANASYSLETLIEAWQPMNQYLDKTTCLFSKNEL